jgi:O-antigen ligase
VSLVFCAGIVDRRWKALCLGSLAVPVVALLMTYSRSSWVSFALAAVVFLALWDKRFLPLIPVAAVIAFPLLPDSIFNRILTIGNTADSSNAYRLFIWASALKMIRDCGLTGIGLGPGNFIPLYHFYSYPTARTAYHSHMLYLEVWLEMGLFGIVSFLMLYLGVIRQGIRAAKEADPLLRSVLIACVSSLAGVSFVSGVEFIWFYPRILYAFFILLGITLAAVKLAEESR